LGNVQQITRFFTQNPAMDHNIDIIFLDEFGDPFGRGWHSKLGNTTLIRRRQLEIADTIEWVEKACIIGGLEPYAGILHTDHYNKKSMVFDVIENYRIWADETVIKIFAGREAEVRMSE